MTWWAQLPTIIHADQHTRRRGRLLAIVLLTLIVLAIVFIPVSLFGPTPALSVGIIAVCVAGFVGMLVLARRGLVMLAGWLFAFTVTAAITINLVMGGTLAASFFLVLAIITASLVLPPHQIWWVMLATLAGTGAVILLRPGIVANPEYLTTLIYAALLQVASAVLSVLGAQAIEQALHTAEANAHEATTTQAQATAQARDLATQADALRRTEGLLHNLVATLETPTVVLADGVLLAPLIGTIDTRRAQTLTERLLRDVAAQRVRLLILELGGITLIDTAIAQTLVQIAQAVRLLGCRVVLTGVAPAVALTLTHLGTNLGGVETARSPQEVLAAHVQEPLPAPAARERARGDSSGW
jgi:anti-anti-sigma regulatory factor